MKVSVRFPTRTQSGQEGARVVVEPFTASG